ncbi:MAG: thioesterase family protein [Acidimicrobiia bacterium]
MARGPWDPEFQHGGPPAALLARAVEGMEAPAPMQVARLTVEFLRPVPLHPVVIATRLARPGRRVQLIEASLSLEGDEVCRARAVRIRTEAVLAAGDLPRPEPAPDLPEEGWSFPRHTGDADRVAFHRDGVELRPLGRPQRGPGTAWIRLRYPLVAGEDPSPLVRVAVAADFGNGISPVLDFRRHLYINPDLTVYLHRLPEGEWVALQSVTYAEAHGVGMAESALFDRRGRIGRSLQSLYLDRR